LDIENDTPNETKNKKDISKKDACELVWVDVEYDPE